MSHLHNLEKIIQNIGIKTTRTFRDTIKQHASYPSIECLVGVLDELKISNISVKLQAEQLHKANFPAIAHILIEDDSHFVLLQSADNEVVRYFDTEKGNQNLSLTEFSKTWSGKTILLSIDAQSTEPNYEANLKKEQTQNLEKGIIYSVVGLLFCVGLYLGQSWHDKVLWFLYGAGAGISVLLLQNEFGQQNEIIQKLCGFAGKATQNTTGCDAVTRSEASKIFGWLSWSEIGLFYFFGGLLVLVISVVLPVVRLLSVIHLCSIIYAIWSVYYQWRVAKQWCVLCLLVQFVSALIFITFLLSGVYEQTGNIQFSDFYVFTVTFAVPVGLWFMIKSHWFASQSVFNLEKDLMGWSRNTELFEAFLQKQPHVEMGHFSKEITLGNPEASIVLTMVSNPFCNPCADAHKEVKALVEYYGDELKVVIRFVGNSLDSQQVINHFYSFEGATQTENIIDDWYNTKDLKSWTLKYPAYKSVATQPETDKITQWVAGVNIEFTPTFFVNGRLLKQPYDIYNFKNFVRALA